MVRKESIFQEKFEWEEENEKEEFKNQTKNSLFVHPKDFTRRQTGGLSINVLSMLMIFVLCYVCLFTVLICYGKILRTIRQFQKCGGVGSRRILKNVGESREEETVALSSHNGRNMVRGSSIYHKRSMHHNQRTHLKSTNNSPNLQPTFSPSSHSTSQIRKSEQQKQQLLLDQYNQHRKKFSTISTAGSPQSIGSCAAAEQGDGGGCGQCHYCTINNNNNNIEQR
uniref:Uncharacterized protein n=1 Tax=Meloidogyne hapla TaxID=6305 RepID=A0A1I8BZ17_MELHA